MTDIEIDEIHGPCPVQADGRVDGKAFYFRARGNRWSLSIGDRVPVVDATWYYEAPWGQYRFEAGYMDEETARHLISRAIGYWREGHPGTESGAAIATTPYPLHPETRHLL